MKVCSKIDSEIWSHKPLDLLERLISENPYFQQWPDRSPANWAVSPNVLRFIHSRLRPGMNTLETGAGQTTVTFAIAGTNHFAITIQPEESQRIMKYCRKKGIQGNLSFIHESSDVAFSRNDFLPESFDFVFIDGAHRFPFPALDWHYTESRLRIGGIMGIDDINIPSVRLLHDFLMGEDEWRLMKIIEKASFFEKIGTADIRFDHQGQKLNKSVDCKSNLSSAGFEHQT